MIKMKTKLGLKMGLLMISFLVFTSVKTVQETAMFEGTYDGQEDYGYNFIGADDEGEEYTMTFQEIDDKVLKSFNLGSDEFIGTKFMVTYNTTTETIKDEDGYEEDIETLTIISLKKL